MQSRIKELNEKYTLEERKENIKQFIESHSNEEGIDLREFYVGCYVNHKSNGQNEEHALADSLAIVYGVKLEKEIIFMDLFQEQYVETTTYVIPGVLSFVPFIRSGLTISVGVNLSELLGRERMSYLELEEFYQQIKLTNYEDLLEEYKEKGNDQFKR